jgi:hypothetical protein
LLFLPFGANRTFAAKSRTISHTADLCVGKSQILPSHSNSHDAVISAYDDDGNMVEKHDHKADFKEW